MDVGEWPSHLPAMENPVRLSALKLCSVIAPPLVMAAQCPALASTAPSHASWALAWSTADPHPVQTPTGYLFPPAIVKATQHAH